MTCRHVVSTLPAASSPSIRILAAGPPPVKFCSADVSLANKIPMVISLRHDPLLAAVFPLIWAGGVWQWLVQWFPVVSQNNFPRLMRERIALAPNVADSRVRSFEITDELWCWMMQWQGRYWTWQGFGHIYVPIRELHVTVTSTEPAWN